MKKIAIICKGFTRDSISQQPWLFFYEISKQLVKQGIAVTIISSASKAQTDTLQGVQVLYVNHFTLVSLFRKNKLLRMIKNEKPDVILWFGSLLSAFSLLHLKEGKKPIIWYTDLGICSPRDFARLSFEELLTHMHLLIFSFIPILSRLVANVANSAIVKTIIVPTFSLRRTLSRIGILKEKIVVIPSAIDKIQPSDILSKEDFQRYRSRLGLDLDDFVITYFGPPCTLRGIDTIVFSLREILKQFRNVKALFLFRKGSKENFWLMQEREKEHLSKTVRKLNLDDYVVMVQGNLSKQTLRNCIRMSDIIVLPFKLLLTEFPLSVLEALALNKTVVTTNIGSLPELTKGSGILVSPSKPSELAATILRMIRQRGKDGQPEQHAQCSYPWDWTKLASLVKDLSERIHKASVRDELSQNLYQRLVLKQKWQIWKKSPLDAYRRLRRRIAYKLFGIRTFDVQTDENLPNLGIDEFGRQVTQGLLFYSGLLRIRGVALHTIVVLGSRAKGRWSPKSDVDVLIIADEIPNRHRRGPIFSDVPIFLGIRPDIFTPSELLSELGCLNTKILDAVYYGKVVYDDGFWSVVNQRVKQFEAEFSLDETHLKEIIHAL